MAGGNIQNLNPATSENAKERGHKGGVISGIVRRKKREAREQLRMLLELPPNADQRAVMERMGIPATEQTNAMAMYIGVMTRAKQGDPRAMECLLKIAGLYTETHGVEQTEPITIRVVTGGDTNDKNI